MTKNADPVVDDSEDIFEDSPPITSREPSFGMLCTFFQHWGKTKV